MKDIVNRALGDKTEFDAVRNEQVKHIEKFVVRQEITATIN